MSSNGPTATTPLTLDAHVRPNSDLLSSELDGEAVILDLSSGVYFGLNPVGARIWELLTAGHSLLAVRAALLDEFDVPPGVCEADLLDVVARMAADGLVTVS
jgi:hypothetical protein